MTDGRERRETVHSLLEHINLRDARHHRVAASSASTFD